MLNTRHVRRPEEMSSRILEARGCAELCLERLLQPLSLCFAIAPGHRRRRCSSVCMSSLTMASSLLPPSWPSRSQRQVPRRRPRCARQRCSVRRLACSHPSSLKFTPVWRRTSNGFRSWECPGCEPHELGEAIPEARVLQNRQQGRPVVSYAKSMRRILRPRLRRRAPRSFVIQRNNCTHSGFVEMYVK
jgi:hypothetical protein